MNPIIETLTLEEKFRLLTGADNHASFAIEGDIHVQYH